MYKYGTKGLLSAMIERTQTLKEE